MTDFLCRKYLPLLKKFPAQYIYEPWKAPGSVQQAAGCIVGKDYPHPIVQHEVISKKNIQRMKSAYAKRSSDKTDSPTKKQGITQILLIRCLSHLVFVKIAEKVLLLQYVFCSVFLIGVKRKGPSVVDMMKNKEKRKKSPSS